MNIDEINIDEIKKIWTKQIKLVNKEFENKTKYLYQCQIYYSNICDNEIYDIEYYSDSSYLFTYLEKTESTNLYDMQIIQYKNELGKFVKIRKYYFDKCKNIVVCELL